RVYLVDRKLAPRYTFARVRNPSRLENSLNLSVFTERSVDHVEREVHGTIEDEIGTFHIDGDYVHPKGAQGADDTFAGLERNFSLGTGSAHEHRDFLVGQVERHCFGFRDHRAQLRSQSGRSFRMDMHSVMQPGLFSNDLYFGLKGDPALLQRGAFDLIDQREHVRRSAVLAIDAEIAVDFAHLHTADGCSLEAKLVDQLASRAHFGILENAAGAGLFRLRRAALMHRLGSLLLDLFRCARRPDEGRAAG